MKYFFCVFVFILLSIFRLNNSTEIKAESMTEIKSGANNELKSQSKTEAKTELQTQTNLKSKTEAKSELKSQTTNLKSQAKSEAKTDLKAQTNLQTEFNSKTNLQSTSKLETSSSKTNENCDQSCFSCQNSLFFLKTHGHTECTFNICPGLCSVLSGRWHSNTNQILNYFKEDQINICEACFRSGYCHINDCQMEKSIAQGAIHQAIENFHFHSLNPDSAIFNLINKKSQDYFIDMDYIFRNLDKMIIQLSQFEKLYAQSIKMKKFYKILLKFLANKSNLGLSDINLPLEIEIDDENLIKNWSDIPTNLQIYKNYYITLKSQNIHLDETKVYLSTDIKSEEVKIKSIQDFDFKVKFSLEKASNMTEIYKAKTEHNILILHKLVKFLDVVSAENLLNEEKRAYLTGKMTLDDMAFKKFLSQPKKSKAEKVLTNLNKSNQGITSISVNGKIIQIPPEIPVIEPKELHGHIDIDVINPDSDKAVKNSYIQNNLKEISLTNSKEDDSGLKTTPSTDNALITKLQYKSQKVNLNVLGNVKDISVKNDGSVIVNKLSLSQVKQMANKIVKDEKNKIIHAIIKNQEESEDPQVGIIHPPVVSPPPPIPVEDSGLPNAPGEVIPLKPSGVPFTQKLPEDEGNSNKKLEDTKDEKSKSKLAPNEAANSKLKESLLVKDTNHEKSNKNDSDKHDSDDTTKKQDNKEENIEKDEHKSKEKEKEIEKDDSGEKSHDYEDKTIPHINTEKASDNENKSEESKEEKEQSDSSSSSTDDSEHAHSFESFKDLFFLQGSKEEIKNYLQVKPDSLKLPDSLPDDINSYFNYDESNDKVTEMKKYSEILEKIKFKKLSLNEIKDSSKKFINNLKTKYDSIDSENEFNSNLKLQHRKLRFSQQNKISKSHPNNVDDDSLNNLDNTLPNNSNNIIQSFSNNLKNLDEEFFELKHNIITNIIK